MFITSLAHLVGIKENCERERENKKEQEFGNIESSLVEFDLLKLMEEIFEP